jgi:hypothetical protein
MSQNHRLDAGGRNRRRLPVAQPPLLGSLEHAAIDQNLETGFSFRIGTGIDQMLRTGDRARRTEKLDVCQESSNKSDFRLLILDCRFVKTASD